MATLWVTGRADVVATAWARVDALAEQAGEQDGQTGATLDQRRADTVLRMLAGTSDRPADVPGVEVRLDVVGVGRSRYRPGAALADAIRARDLTCRFPGCRHRATACDLDHCVAWPEGDTRPDNLACLCRHHHRLKHRAGWRLDQHPTEHLTWTSPSGARYTTYPPTWDTGPPPPDSGDGVTYAWEPADDGDTGTGWRDAASWP